MIVEIKCRFAQGAAPSPDAIKRAIEDRTGLVVTFGLSYEDVWLLSSPDFRSPEQVTFSEDAVAVIELGTQNRWSYLVWQTFAALIGLGADYRGPALPTWIDTKWADRKWWQRLPR